MDSALAPLNRTPELFPYSLDPRTDTVDFRRLCRADFEAASFLDGRILTPAMHAETLPWPQVSALITAAGLEERCQFIFHIGHVGSTLLSRLIGAHPGAFALREPLVLRTFAVLDGEPGQQPRWRDHEFDDRLSGCLCLLSRTFESRQRAVIKATSFVSELAGRLMMRPSAPRAIMMAVPPESYLATIFGGPNSRREGALLAPSRLRRLHRRVGCEAWRLEALSEGEVLALGWTCEMSALAAAAGAAGKRMLRIDFEQFLADPNGCLAVAMRHLEIDATRQEIATILNGPLLQRYSKAPQFAYDQALRRDVLTEARATHGAEIARGLRWIERAAAAHPAVRSALAVLRS